jgi:Uma2 family endonuclease
MSTTTRITFEDFQKLQEAAPEAVSYELDEGEPVLTPSPTPYHNIVRYRLRSALTDFVQTNRLGVVIDETDFRLSTITVRKPDVAFIPQSQVKDIDFRRSPIAVAPRLAVEVISPGNLAQDTMKKVRQYLGAGSQAVWLVYPDLRLVQIHDASGIRDLTESESIQEERLFPGLKFHLSLSALFDDSPER